MDMSDTFPEVEKVWAGFWSSQFFFDGIAIAARAMEVSFPPKPVLGCLLGSLRREPWESLNWKVLKSHQPWAMSHGWFNQPGTRRESQNILRARCCANASPDFFAKFMHFCFFPMQGCIQGAGTVCIYDGVRSRKIRLCISQRSGERAWQMIRHIRGISLKQVLNQLSEFMNYPEPWISHI